MLVSLAKNPEAKRRRMVALVECGPETFAAIDDTHLPWTTVWNEPGEDCTFSITSVPFLVKLPGFRGYTDEKTKRAIQRYLVEAISTSKKRSLVGIPPNAYPWASLLSKEFTPRRYQIAGMERLWRRVVSKGAILRGQILKDDVGLGKTVQIAGVIARMIEEGMASASAPVIVVSSPSVTGQWHDELRRFVPSLDAPGLVSLVSGDKAARVYKMRSGAVVYVMHHQMLRLPQYDVPVSKLFGVTSGVILDESSAFANHESLTTIRARKLCRRVPFVIATNATPIENKLSDSFGQMSVVDEPVLGSMSSFGARYIERDPRYGQEVRAMNLGEFKVRIAGSWFGRRHEDVDSELPAVISQVRDVELSEAQQRAYDAAVGSFVSNEETGAIALSRLAAVERAALAEDTSNLKSVSAKVDDLASLLEGDLSSQRVLVFSKYRVAAIFAANRLADFSPFLIHGGVSFPERDSIRKKFSGSSGRVLIGTEAMARGMNLQAASVVVNLDLPWNHAKLRQRVGRVARIGQQRKSVLVISYRATIPGRATVDDYFISKIMQKRDLSDAVYGSDSVDEIASAPVDVDAVREFLRRR